MALKRDGTDNLIDLYMEYVGYSEVPKQYHLWCCYSAIAAAVSNRVWAEKLPGRKLAPNLYIALIGPSAIGKGEAIETMLDVTRDLKRINVFKGKVTAPALLDQMAVPAKSGGVPWSHLYLITPELSWSMGKGDWADMLVKQMTELYTGSADAIKELTRTRGSVRIKPGELCINWLAGTTQEWMGKTIPRASVSGGFYGRIVGIFADYDFSVRYRRPIVPADRAFLQAMIVSRLAALTKYSGLMVASPEADAIDETWYMNRQPPPDPDLQAAFRRQHDLVWKLAMIMSLADETMTITGPTMANAQKFSDMSIKGQQKMVNYGDDTQGVAHAEYYLKRFPGPVPHSMLLKHLAGKGFDADGTFKIVRTLVEMGKILVTGGLDHRKRFYTYQGKKKMPLAEIEYGATNGNGAAPSDASEGLDHSEPE